MCGIAGGVGLPPGAPDMLTVLHRMCDAMVHRGPDDSGYFAEGEVGLGMRRLSIVDIAGGHQPVATDDGRLHLVFNGEIYNHRELRRELEATYPFRSQTDSEVLLHGM